MRPKTFNPEEVIALAMETFWRNGFEATNMPELLEAMGVGRASFYNAFTSKRDVFLKALELYFATLDTHLSAAIENATTREQATAKVIDAIFAVAKNENGWRGCLLGNTALEMGHRDAEVNAKLTQGLIVLQKLFVKALSKPSSGQRVLRVKPEALALHLVGGIQGLLLMAKGGLTKNEIATARDVLLSNLD
jgi:TetR/AcrR family transcriptional regulator, transcriptional repressor for nem operon